MEAAVTFAEERGIAHVAARGRCGLARRQPVLGPARAGADAPPCASRRPTCVRAKLTVGGRTRSAVRPSRQLAQVLAARRSLRGQSRERARGGVLSLTARRPQLGRQAARR